MTDRPLLPQDIWETLTPEAQAAVLALVAAFEQRIAALEERLNTNSTNSSRPPSSDAPSVKRRPPIPPSGKKRGGQPGHHRRVRVLVPPEQVRQLVVCKPTHCRECGGDLQGDDPEPLRHQVAELPPVLPVVDEYQLHRLACPRCRIRTCGTLPPGVPTGVFGPRLRAVLSVLVGAYRLGKRPVQQLVLDLLGLSISLGMISRLERQGAAELEAPVEELRRHVRDAASAHIDETSWRQGRASRHPSSRGFPGEASRVLPRHPSSPASRHPSSRGEASQTSIFPGRLPDIQLPGERLPDIHIFQGLPDIHLPRNRLPGFQVTSIFHETGFQTSIFRLPGLPDIHLPETGKASRGKASIHPSSRRTRLPDIHVSGEMRNCNAVPRERSFFRRILDTAGRFGTFVHYWRCGQKIGREYSPLCQECH